MPSDLFVHDTLSRVASVTVKRTVHAMRLGPGVARHQKRPWLPVTLDVTSFKVGCGVHAVRVEEMREGDDVRAEVPNLQFGFLSSESLARFHEKGTRKELLDHHGYVSPAYDFEDLQPLTEANWNELLSGNWQAWISFEIGESNVMFSLAEGRMEDVHFFCFDIYARLRELPVERREAAVRAFLSIPGMSATSCPPGRQSDNQVAGVLRGLQRHDRFVLFWEGNGQFLDRVMDCVTSEASDRGDECVTGPDGKSYPVEFESAVQEALLSLHPEAAAALASEPTAAPAWGR